MFKVSILNIQKASSIFKDTASEVVLPGEEGELSILDFHQPIVSRLKDGVVKVDQKHSIRIKKGIAKMEKDELFVLVEQ